MNNSNPNIENVNKLVALAKIAEAVAPDVLAAAQEALLASSLPIAEQHAQEAFDALVEASKSLSDISKQVRQARAELNDLQPQFPWETPDADAIHDAKDNLSRLKALEADQTAQVDRLKKDYNTLDDYARRAREAAEARAARSCADK